MADDGKLVAEKRTQIGTSHSRRLRCEGKVPVNLYGLGQESVNLTISGDDLKPFIVSGSQVCDLVIDGAEQKALVKEVQWDTFLLHILHADFQRVDPQARVDVEIPIATRGTVNEGVLEHVLHEISVNCPVYNIPEKVEVRIGALKIGDEVTIADLAFDADLTSVLASDTVVLRISEPQEVEIEQQDVDAAGEPEVIGRSATDEDE
ncbi:MAG: 50S ribosomal protein L25 [Planctomycetota bacterium]|nr:50S ribosomal protein L25 [Planctomycetota bacterium]MDA1161356.1 50S ribosomal protein L25 [Planctomycetota bacterium]